MTFVISVAWLSRFLRLALLLLLMSLNVIELAPGPLLRRTGFTRLKDRRVPCL